MRVWVFMVVKEEEHGVFMCHMLVEEQQHTTKNQSKTREAHHCYLIYFRFIYKKITHDHFFPLPATKYFPRKLEWTYSFVCTQGKWSFTVTCGRVIDQACMPILWLNLCIDYTFLS